MSFAISQSSVQGKRTKRTVGAEFIASSIGRMNGGDDSHYTLPPHPIMVQRTTDYNIHIYNNNGEAMEN